MVAFSLYAWSHFAVAIAATSFKPEITPAGKPGRDLLGKHVVAQPRITPGPSINQAALQKRDSSTASFNTCGFINTDADSALYCGGAYSCVFFSSTAGTPGMAGCCAESYATCNWYSTCYDSTQLSTACTDSACRSDAMALRCTETASPRCARWTWPALGVADFACTYADDDGDATPTAGPNNWTTIAVTAVDTFFSEPTSWSVNVTWAPASALSAPRADVNSTTESSSSSTSGTEASSTSDSATTSTSTAGTGGSGVSTGAIIGGVVGGVVGFVGLLAAAIMFCCLMRRRKQQQQGGQQEPSSAHEMHEPINPQYLPPAEVSGHSSTVYYTHSSSTPVELEHSGRVFQPVELDARPKAAEMGI
ncbi:hypothetical protein DIS24_g8084 [Lasiodiplodia hormozganensis]|uniref:Uncharacterized protein n=1 Tax=Lasiodiplodia hormozganensis TaxID=869390 RepID=A0AA39Y3H3_9PEZI|nr:hypothetical protein DIS24_g8084 [Lasiodiplodia hormozganensis]